jgi:hypothetical protein
MTTDAHPAAHGATVTASDAGDLAATLRRVADTLGGTGSVALRAFADGLVRRVPDRPRRIWRPVPHPGGGCRVGALWHAMRRSVGTVGERWPSRPSPAGVCWWRVSGDVG